jgi:hypothetical protein
MKKIFISLPMNGLDENEIKDDIASLQEYIEGIFADEDEEINFIDSFVEEESPDDVNEPVWYLSKSIELISGANLAVFAPGWENARGCIVEHMVCALYSVPYVEINPDTFFFDIDEAFDDSPNDVQDNTHDWDVAGQVNAEISDAYSEATGVGEGFEHGDSDDNPYATHGEITQTIFDEYDDELEPGEYNADEDIQ